MWELDPGVATVVSVILVSLMSGLGWLLKRTRDDKDRHTESLLKENEAWEQEARKQQEAMHRLDMEIVRLQGKLDLKDSEIERLRAENERLRRERWQQRTDA